MDKSRQNYQDHSIFHLVQAIFNIYDLYIRIKYGQS